VLRPDRQIRGDVEVRPPRFNTMQAGRDSDYNSIIFFVQEQQHSLSYCFRCGVSSSGSINLHFSDVSSKIHMKGRAVAWQKQFGGRGVKLGKVMLGAGGQKDADPKIALPLVFYHHHTLRPNIFGPKPSLMIE
jgi:hypothetical protein